MANFDVEIPKVFENEGGYNHIPGDAGGETNFGISKRAYPNVDIKALTKEMAADIYKRDYWDAIKGDGITSQEIAGKIFDVAVNMGTGRASKFAQKIAGAHVDGDFGPNTLKAVNNALSDENQIDCFHAEFTLAQIGFYADICNRKPDQKKFLLGWVNRALK